MKIVTFAMGLTCLIIALLFHMVSSPSYRTMFDLSAVFAMGAWIFFWNTLNTNGVADRSLSRSLLIFTSFVFVGDIVLVLTTAH